jgi:hypothetical protein
MRIPVGWPLVNSGVAFTFKDLQGRWTRHNRAETTETHRIKGTQAGKLKVCWGYKAGATNYYGDAGILEFVQPPEMQEAAVSFTTTQYGVVAPVVISFTTRKGDHYHNSENAGCMDTPGYVDVNGYDCSTWTGLDCTRAAEDLGYPQQVVQDLVVHCRKTCGTCQVYTTTEPNPRKLNAVTSLTIRFLDTSSTDGAMEPYYADELAPDVGTYDCLASPLHKTCIGKREHVLEADHRQWVCGRVFKELWSSHSEGFPMPSGCWFTKKYKDNEVVFGQDNMDFYRDFTMVFPEANGLKDDTSYQMVMNAKMRSIVKGQNIVDIYSTCNGNGCIDTNNFNTAKLATYHVFEKGTGKADQTIVGGAQFSDPQFGPNGFTFMQTNPADNVLDLSSDNLLQMRLIGKDNAAAIRKNCILRVSLWPITLWELEPACAATCESATQGCSGEVTCSAEPVVVGTPRRNMLKLVLPSVMTDITSTTNHTFKVGGLKLPKAGFFGTRAGAQITRAADSRPSYTISYGYLMKRPDVGQTTGKLLVSGRTGYGSKPFMGDKGNILYARITFGATLWNNGQENATTIVLTVPDGYTCGISGNGKSFLEDEQFSRQFVTEDAFKGDDDTNGYFDISRGFLSVATADGTWAMTAGRQCVYQTRQYTRIYAGMVAYVKLAVQNPATPVRKPAPTNVWSIQISGKGASATSIVYDMDVYHFETTEAEKNTFVSSVAVLSKLTDKLMQPSELRRSTVYPLMEMTPDLRIWVKTNEYVGRHGYFIVDAPAGFDFGENCTAGDLPKEYYYFRGVQHDLVHRLGGMGKCSGLKTLKTSSTYTRARIFVKDVIAAGTTYGFQIRILHPATYDVSQHYDWYLWTEDTDFNGLEGSVSTMRFNKDQYQLGNASVEQFYHRSYGMYNGLAPSDFGVTFDDLRPKSVTGKHTLAHFSFLSFALFTDTSMRITAPYGFKFTINFFQKAVLGNSTGVWPNDPIIENGNQLVFPKLSFANGKIYGFTIRTDVPDYPPTTSSNNLFIEFGYNNPTITERNMVSILPGPPIKAISDCSIVPSSNLAAYDSNRIEITFHIVTKLGLNEGVIIEGDYRTKGTTPLCPLRVLNGSSQFPSDVKCIAVQMPTGLPRIVIKSQELPIHPGWYRFELKAINPPYAAHSANTWTFGSYAGVQNYPRPIIPVDNKMTVPGYRINQAMWMPACIA